MSNIGKQPILIPENVEVIKKASDIIVKGKLGELKETFNSDIQIEINDKDVIITRNSDEKIQRFLNIDIPYIYINKLEDINAIMGQQQLENILGTLYLLDNNKQDKIESTRRANIQKCIQIC